MCIKFTEISQKNSTLALRTIQVSGIRMKNQSIHYHTKRVAILVLASVLSSSCFAQWTTSGTNINFVNGIVSVGTTKAPTGFKLAVGGSLIAEEVVIKVQASWPDYVFAPGYKKFTLSELEKYIIANKHLPDVPAAQQVEDEGVKVGEMNYILLKKIEELTLYVIELKKEIETIKSK